MAGQFPQSIEEARALLASMGQSGAGGFDANNALATLPNSVDAVSSLLRSMGQTSQDTNKYDAPIADPLFTAMAKGVDPVGNAPRTLEDTKVLLRSLGLTGIDTATPDMAKALTNVVAQSVAAPVAPSGIAATVATAPSAAASAGEPKDPLAADKNGWNLPKTDVANTTGAAQRINARAQAEGTGVTATKDANGRLILSNIGTGGPSQVATSTPHTLAGSVELLRRAQDPETAAGIMMNIRTTAALEASKLNTDAMVFAGNKLGVPGMERALRDSEANDRRSPSWFPGIGDSPGTAKIRNDLNHTRAAADVEAKRYLDTNTNVAAMKATLSTAEAEIGRINRMADRKQGIMDNLDARNQAKEDMRTAEAEATLGAMTPDVIARLSVLNPQLAYSEDKQGTLARLYKDASKNKDRVAAIQATASQLPLLALNGNQDAIALTVAEEIKNNPGINKDLVENRLMRIRERANAPGFEKEVIKHSFGSLDSPEAKSALGNMNAAKVGGDATAKAQDRMSRFNAALEIERKETTLKFAQDTSTWGVSDPLFLAAQQNAFKNTGQRGMDQVVTAYLDGAVGAAAIEKLQSFNALLDASVAKQGKSLFGVPDIKALKASAFRRVRQDPSFLQGLLLISQGGGIPGAAYAGGPGNLFGGMDAIK